MTVRSSRALAEISIKTVTFLCDRNGIVKDYTAKRKGGTLLRAA